MILLSEKGAHGVSSRCEKVGMLLPQRSYGSTLKNQDTYALLHVISHLCRDQSH